jgi:hypothetical protein
MISARSVREKLPTGGYVGLLIAWTVVAGLGIVLSLFVTNPLAIGPLGVTLWFLLLLSVLAAGFTLALYGIKTYLHVHDGAARNRFRYSWRQGWLLAGWGVGILAMGSLHQFSLRDAILLGLLLGIIEVYMRFRRS